MRAMPSLPSSRRSAAAVVALTTLAACDGSRTPTAAGEPERPGIAAAVGAGDGVAASTEVVALGTIPLPVNQSISYTGTALRVTNTSTGGAAGFLVSNTSNANPALLGQSNGTGPAVKGYQNGTGGNAGLFQIANSSNPRAAVYGFTNGLGSGGAFEITNSSNGTNAVLAKTNGRGSAIRAEATGLGTAGTFVNSNASNGANAVYVQSSGPGQALSVVSLGLGNGALFTKTGGPNSTAAAVRAQHAGGGAAVHGVNTGYGRGGLFEATSVEAALTGSQRGLGLAAFIVTANPSSTSPTLFVQSNGANWAGTFRADNPGGRGVQILTSAGAPGLQVIGGTKNAVVGTTTGARELYTEESSEVWFTDYGFARLAGGRARILLDPTFAETIDVGAPYHVFVEPYGNAALYVAERTPLGFVVQLRDGEPDVEFSYRVVAKRQGFAHRRLERAPWADASPGLAAAGAH